MKRLFGTIVLIAIGIAALNTFSVGQDAPSSTAEKHVNIKLNATKSTPKNPAKNGELFMKKTIKKTATRRTRYHCVFR